ncbi:MAG: hypothetical protein H7328_02130 [Bdellovibrio sp.]|nr:hypothetical protein [Bdellovibrio sp.]
MFLKTIKFSLVISSLLAVTQAQAARVIQSKNNKVMIELDGAQVSIGQDLFLLNAQNKKVGLIKILQIKNDKAVASLTKGKSDGTETVQISTAPSAAVSPIQAATIPTVKPSAQNVKPFYRAETKKASIVLSMMSNSMTTKQADATMPTPNVEDVAMKGATFGITGALDWPIVNKFSLRGTAGYEPFKATGTAKFKSCDNLQSFDCTADITYLSGGGYIRYDFTKEHILFWTALGATLKYPVSKNTTALKMEDIKLTMTYGGALGLDYFVNLKYFVPVSLEYQAFLKSDTVDANIIILRAGFGMAL